MAEIVRAFAAPLVARSSAVGEDSEQASFAGQHLTRLNVRSTPELAEAVSAIWESARLPSALAYRERLGLPLEPRMAVVVQELVEADSAGVLFSRDPVNGSDELLVEAAWGLGEAVVAGLVTPDRFRMARNGTVLERAAGVRTSPYAPTRKAARGDRGSRRTCPCACLDDSQLAALHALVLGCDESSARGTTSSGHSPADGSISYSGERSPQSRRLRWKRRHDGRGRALSGRPGPHGDQPA